MVAVEADTGIAQRLTDVDVLQRAIADFDREFEAVIIIAIGDIKRGSGSRSQPKRQPWQWCIERRLGQDLVDMVDMKSCLENGSFKSNVVLTARRQAGPCVGDGQK